MADLITRLRLTLRPAAPAGDADLLARFAERHDQDAFAELIGRHGSMVYGVCRRALGDGPDAEDAYQATFLVLAKRAEAVAKMTSVAGWLYGVACLTAKKARGRRAKRRLAETTGRLPDVPSPVPTAEPDLGAVIDEELAKVPEAYRTAVVLCELRQLTLGEAAAELGVPRGTVASRLARGRGMLGKRLLRRGLFAAGVGGGGAAFGRVPLPLDERLLGLVSLQAVAPDVPAGSLSQEVLHAMTRTKRLACCAGLLLVAGLVLGGIALTATPTAAAPVPDLKAKGAEELKVLDRVTVENIGGLLGCPTVAKELALTDEQKAKLDEVWGEVSGKLIGQFKARLKGAKQTPELMLVILGFIDELVRENDTEAVKVLTADQLRRLKQIQLQKEGPAALLGRYAVRALDLSPQQEDKLTRVVGRLNKTGFLMINFELGAAEEAAGQNAVEMKDTVRRVLAAQATDVDSVAGEAVKVLTDEQKTRWRQMTGEPIPTAELLKATSPFSDRRIVKASESVQNGNAGPQPAPAPQPPAKEEKEKK